MSSDMKEAQKKIKEKRDTEKVLNHEIAEEVFKATKEQLLPSIREKAEEVSKYVEKVLKEKNDKGLTASQISSIFIKRSANDIANNTISYTPQELSIAFNIYVDMIQEINKHCKFPPSKGTFCQLLGITTQTYDNYMQDSNKTNIMHYIDNYISDIQLISAQINELQPIATMFSLKSQHGFVEATTPIVIKHEKTKDIDDIRAKLNSMKNKTIEADYEEK